MSDGPPKRYSSTELTAVIPRESLAPVSMAVPPTLDELADVAQAHREAQDEYPTLVPCPNCSDCGLCGGCHSVAPRVAARHLAMIARLEALSEPEDESA